MADTNSQALHYVAEVTAGTTPTDSDNWKSFEYTGETFQPTYNTAQSETIRNDGMRGDVYQVSATSAGDINYEVRAVVLDDFLEAVLGGTWTTNVLKVGTTKRSFSFEKFIADLASGNKYEIATGVRVNQMTLNMQYGQLGTGAMGLMGTSWADAATSAVGSGTLTAPAAFSVMNGATDVTDVEVDGSDAGLYFQNVNLTLGAGLRSKTAIGDLFPFDHGYGSRVVELSASAYFDSRTLENKVRSGAAFSMGFTLSDGANDYEILLPRAFVTTRDGLSAQQRDGDIIPNVTITGAFDESSGSSIVITRSLA